MYLKRIELQGFKSFADKTVIEVHDGVTAIVGPNGSGKSNISDAIRWVMGEQSAKTLRGGKMEDVIFAGTQKRKPLGFAQVSLVLDNSTHFLPVDYDEVEITRRVFRSGESEYLINKNACRLKDINELLMDTGLGRDGYSIIGQGKIAERVSSKGDERRQIFEEAAGISKYRYRKNEAERKLFHTGENLVRVRDILSELSERVEPLKKQSEKAMKYLDLREELKGIETSALLEIIDRKREEAQKTAKIYDDAVSRFEKSKKTLEEYNAKSDELYSGMREEDEKLSALREKLSSLESDKAAIDNKDAIIKNNIENHKVNIFRIDTELSGWSKRGEALKEDMARLEKEKIGLSSRFDELARDLLALEQTDAQLAKNTAERTAALEKARNEALLLRQKKGEAQSRIESIDLITQNIETRRFSIEVDIASANDNAARLRMKCRELEEKSKQADSESEKRQDAVFSANQAFHDANKKSAQLKEEYNVMTKRLGEKQGRLKMLEEMERGLEGYARGVRELLKAEKDGRYKGALIGVLSKLVTVEKKYTTAVETALGNAMQNIVVETEQQAKQAIEYLKANNIGRVTFLPISSQEGKRLDNEERVLQNDGIICIAADVADCDRSIKNVVEALLGRTVIAEDMDSAIKLARATHYKFKIVTLSGELLAPGGSVTGGSVNRAQALLGRKDEIELLKKECEKLLKETQKLEDNIDDLADSAEESRRTEAKCREQFSEAENKAMKLKAEYEMKKNLLEIAEERKVKLENEKEQIASQKTDTDATLKKLHEVLENSDGLIENAERTVQKMQEAVREATLTREKHSEKIIDKKMEMNSAQKDVEIAQSRIEDIQKSADNSVSDYNDRVEQKRAEEQRIGALEEEILQNDMHRKQCEAATETVREELKARSAQRGGNDALLEDIREKTKTLNDEILAMQGEVVRIENRKGKIEEELESAANRLWEDYELTYNSALEIKKDIGSLPEAQKKISSLKASIRALGNINVDSIEEYKEVKNRYEFMNNQVEDMQKAKSNLEKLISEMIAVMREQFAKKFDIINELFGKSFVDLFGGGKAEVKLLNPLDTLESPIEIEVQPPGKKLQSITLLSGGEHALTAIALLFALLQVSPAPFLVLDEIEAALDDENVYRFGDYIRNYGNNTQFVVITHRRGTMEAADVLYGVTMQERGVSRLLSMKLEDVAFEE